MEYYTYLHVSLVIFFWLFNRIIEGETLVKLPENATVPAVIAFGDSIVDQGNNNHMFTLVKANFPPYGQDFMGGNPTGRFTNGKTPADLLAEGLGIKEYLPAYFDPAIEDKDLLTGVSFGSGGSGYDPQTPEIVAVLSLTDQLELFKEYVQKLKRLVGEEGTTNILSNSIFMLVSSSNDLANTYFTVGARRLEYDIPTYADLLVSSASDFIQEIYQLGARRIAVFGAAPIGCVPSRRTLGGGAGRVCAEDCNLAAQVLNTKLNAKLQSLSSKFPQSKLVFADIYNPFLDMIQNPTPYGFEVVDRGCCGTGDLEVAILCNKFDLTCTDDSKFLFWDSYHPTEKGYSIIIHQFIEKYIKDFF